MILFFDASALVKRYVREIGSQFVTRLLADSSPVICRLTEAEVASALARKCRAVELSPKDRRVAITHFRADLQTLAIVEVIADVTALVHDLVVTHPLRASDAVQLAAALLLKRSIGSEGSELGFVGWDATLNDAAAAEGFKIYGPSGR